MIEETVASILWFIKTLTPLALAVSGFCAWVAARWPVPRQPGFWKWLNWAVNILGGNVFYATNRATNKRKSDSRPDKRVKWVKGADMEKTN
jgi:hypothetical protein